MKTTLGGLINAAQISVERLQSVLAAMERNFPDVLVRNPEIKQEYDRVCESLSRFDTYPVDIQVDESMKAADFMRRFKFLCETVLDEPSPTLH